MTSNIRCLTIIENKAKVRTFRNKPQVLSNGGTSTQIDAIAALNKQVEALGVSFLLAFMRETYDQINTDGLTLDGSFLPHSNFLVYQENDQEPETITEVVEIASSKSTPLVPPPETPPLSAPKPKEVSKPNPYQPPILYPCRLQVEKSQALENPMGRVDHFVYRIDIVDSLCDKLPIENNSLSVSPTLSPDPVFESLSPSLTPSGEIDLLLKETDAFLSLDDLIPPGIDNGIYDSEGDILFLEELLNDEIPRDLPPKELKDDEPSTSKSLIETPLEIDNEIYDSEGDILFLENLLKDEPSKADKSEIYTLIGEPPDTFLMEDEEIELNPFQDIDDSVPIPRIFNIQNEHSDEPETETIMDEVHSTPQIPPLFEELTSDKSMQDIILHRIRHGMVNSSRLSFYHDLFSPMKKFGSFSSDSFKLEIPSGESKVHIEVLSVLWGNRLPIPDGSLPLSRYGFITKEQKQWQNDDNRDTWEWNEREKNLKQRHIQ
ncbi:hypothetical protein Tco_0439400 [Tanacetum coccineum]